MLWKNFRLPNFLFMKLLWPFHQNLNLILKKNKNWLQPLLKLAAVIAIGITVNYYTATLDTKVDTHIAQKTTIQLPDDSKVKLNANS